MSIYFIHLFLESFLVSFFASYLCKNYSVFKIISSVLFGFIFGYIVFYIFNYSKANKIALIVADIIMMISLLLVFLRRFNVLAIISAFTLSLSCALRYFLVSVNFPIFESSLLDTQGIFNFSFILLALFICAVFFVSFLFVVKNSSSMIGKIIVVLIAIMFINECLAELVLYAIRTNALGALSDSDALLSYSAKSKYYVEFYYYICLIFAIVYVGACLKLRPKYREKKDFFDIEYRQNIAKTSTINTHFCITFILSIASFLIILFYDLVASKPLAIDEPIIISPKTNDYFIFDLKAVSDGKLHRYAYISSTGKKIRFFIINRFAGKITPTVVFDSCMICGDQGYIQKDGELICVACNVRIFLPSVGKAGGCNPIPVEDFIVDESSNELKIKLKSIIDGENYFSEYVDIDVINPVTGDKFKNSKAKKTYMYNGINYYFNDDDSYEKFKKNPEKYVSSDERLPYRLDGYKS